MNKGVVLELVLLGAISIINDIQSEASLIRRLFR